MGSSCPGVACVTAATEASDEATGERSAVVQNLVTAGRWDGSGHAAGPELTPTEGEATPCGASDSERWSDPAPPPFSV